jgi:hypothetical protein
MPSDAIRVYPGFPPSCSRCRSSPPRTYSDDITLAAAHHADGHRQTQCPECGYWRWPWECPTPESMPSGLRWVATLPWRCRQPRWSLYRGCHYLGSVARRRGDREWTALDCGLVVHRGTLSDCALALVEAVTGPADNLHG